MNTWNYTTSEFDNTLRRAFEGQDTPSKTCFIMLDGHAARNPYIRESWAYALEQGYIRSEWYAQDEQNGYYKGFLTEHGAQALGINPKKYPF